MKDYRTPQMLSARSSENATRRSKDFSSNKSNKITKKGLNAAFTSVSEGAFETSKDSAPISEISDANADGDVTETFLLEEASSVNFLPSHMTPSKKITDGTGSSSVNFGAFELDSSKFTSVEAEIAANFLRKAQSEVLNTVNTAPQYKKLMDEITNFVMEELSTLPEERDRFAQEVSVKNRMLFLCFFLWVIGVSAVLFFTSNIHCSFGGPLPT